MVTKNEWMRQNRARKRALGLCVDCGNPMDKMSGSVCTLCLEKRRKYGESRKEKNKIYHRELRAKRKEQNLCRDCGEPLLGDQHYLCEKCRERQRLYSINAKARGNKPKPQDTERQRAYTKALRAQRVALGLCPYCGDPMDRLEGLRCNKCREKYRKYRKEYYQKHKKSEPV